MSTQSAHRLAAALERALIQNGQTVETHDGLLCLEVQTTYDDGEIVDRELVPLIDIARDMERYLS